MKLKIRRSGSEYYLSIIGKNGETLGHTENYKQKASATHCAQLLKEQAGGATVIDETE